MFDLQKTLACGVQINLEMKLDISHHSEKSTHLFADRRAMHNPITHVAPGVCTAILSTNDRTVDFRPLRRPTNAYISATHQDHQTRIRKNALT